MQTIKRYRFLFEQLVKRDFTLKYKRTVLGIFWSVLSPLLTLLIQILVFSHFFSGEIPHYTTFLFSGNLVYSFFSESTSGGLGALVANAPIFSKINVPKYLFVVTKNISTLINFLITFLVFLIFAWFDGITFTWKFVFLLYAIICMFSFNCGVSLILSALYMFFRDMSYLYNILTLLLMYLSAIFYSIDTFSPLVQTLFLCNPLYVYIKYFRLIVIDSSIPTPFFHGLMLLYAVVVIAVGGFIYRKCNNRFLYYV